MEPLVDARRVGEVIGASRSCVYIAAERQILPSYKVGGFRLFKLSEVEEWIRARKDGAAR